MAGTITRGVAAGVGEAAVAEHMRERGLRPQVWGNAPGDTYGWHQHGYRKVLYCVAGSIVFHTDDGELSLQAGDRLDLPAHTQHAATVGPDGCRCVEAPDQPS